MSAKTGGLVVLYNRCIRVLASHDWQVRGWEVEDLFGISRGKSTLCQLVPRSIDDVHLRRAVLHQVARDSPRRVWTGRLHPALRWSGVIDLDERRSRRRLRDGDRVLTGCTGPSTSKRQCRSDNDLTHVRGLLIARTMDQILSSAC